MNKSNNRRVGTYYEEKAIVFLENAGYCIIKHNYRCKLGEVDIIARDGEYLCFIEVKYRSSNVYGSPMFAVNRKKQQRISKSAVWFMKEYRYELSTPVRFDVVSIQDEKIQLVKDAFPYSY